MLPEQSNLAVCYLALLGHLLRYFLCGCLWMVGTNDLKPMRDTHAHLAINENASDRAVLISGTEIQSATS